MKPCHCVLTSITALMAAHLALRRYSEAICCTQSAISERILEIELDNAVLQKSLSKKARAPAAA